MYGGGKETKSQQKRAKYHSGNIFDRFYPITRGDIANPPLFHLAGEITQARPVPDGASLANTFADDGKITPAKERKVLKGFKDKDFEN